METKPRNCPSWIECIKHVGNIHYLLDQKDLEEALADPKAHWDSLEESKVRKRGIETQYQGQSTLDDCVEEVGRRSAEIKDAWPTWRACVLLRIYLCTWASTQGL